jgi:hypothetical protein
MGQKATGLPEEDFRAAEKTIIGSSALFGSAILQK